MTGEELRRAAIYTQRLDALEDYFAGVPAETARFTRDQDFLQQVKEKSEQRVRVIQKLQILLQSVQ
jgi:hypothetical protein